MDKKTKSELQNRTGINDFEKLTNDERNQMLTLIFKKQLPPPLLAALVQLSPSIITALSDITKQAARRIEDAGKAQLASIEVLRQLANSVDSLKEIAISCKTDKCRIKIAEGMIQTADKITTTIEAINKENNSFWQKFWATTGKVLAAILGIVIVGVIASADQGTNLNKQS
jgi:hypothetical protein